MKITLFFILFLASVNAKAQTDFFEGKVLFKIEYFDSLGVEIPPASLGKDSEMHYFISGGNYKSLNENGVIKQLFNSSDNKYYFNNQETIQVLDASFKYPQTGSVKMLDIKKNILGRECSSLSIVSENDSTNYYYSNEILVDKTKFQNHNFGLWNLLLNSSNGGFTLEYDIYYPKMRVKMTAIEISNMDLSKDDFDIQLYLK